MIPGGSKDISLLSCENIFCIQSSISVQMIADMTGLKVVGVKNKSYSSPIMKFSKAGNYTITTTVGSAKKVITVKVSK